MKNKLNKATWFDHVNVILFIIMAFLCFYPLWHVLATSLSTNGRVMRGGLYFFPDGFNIESYSYVLSSNYLTVAFKNSVFITVLGTFISVLITASFAYMASKKHIPGYKLFNGLVIFAVLFNGGLIPTYLVVNSLGLVDSLWALIFLVCLNPFNVIIVRNFFSHIPPSMEESAYMDGAGPATIFFRIIMPLSKPVLATIAIWVAVGLWNEYMNGLIYLTSRENYILPVLIRDIVLSQSMMETNDMPTVIIGDTVKSATIIIAIVPIIMIYPFLQKYFTKGIMLGAIKG